MDQREMLAQAVMQRGMSGGRMGMPSDMLAAAPTPGMLGSGGAMQAGQAMSMRAYKLYAAEAQAMGQPVLSPEEWMQQQQQQQQGVGAPMTPPMTGQGGV